MTEIKFSQRIFILSFLFFVYFLIRADISIHFCSHQLIFINCYPPRYLSGQPYFGKLSGIIIITNVKLFTLAFLYFMLCFFFSFSLLFLNQHYSCQNHLQICLPGPLYKLKEKYSVGIGINANLLFMKCSSGKE